VFGALVITRPIVATLVVRWKQVQQRLRTASKLFQTQCTYEPSILCYHLIHIATHLFCLQWGVTSKLTSGTAKLVLGSFDCP